MTEVKPSVNLLKIVESSGNNRKPAPSAAAASAKPPAPLSPSVTPLAADTTRQRNNTGAPEGYTPLLPYILPANKDEFVAMSVSGASSPQNNASKQAAVADKPAAPPPPATSPKSKSHKDARREMTQAHGSVTQAIQADRRQFDQRSATAPTQHTVKSGQTSWEIAKANNLSLAQLQAFNSDVKDLGKIRPGQTLNLTRQATAAASVPAAPAPKAAAPATAPVAAAQAEDVTDMLQRHQAEDTQISAPPSAPAAEAASTPPLSGGGSRGIGGETAPAAFTGGSTGIPASCEAEAKGTAVEMSQQCEAGLAAAAGTLGMVTLPQAEVIKATGNAAVDAKAVADANRDGSIVNKDVEYLQPQLKPFSGDKDKFIARAHADIAESEKLAGSTPDGFLSREELTRLYGGDADKAGKFIQAFDGIGVGNPADGKISGDEAVAYGALQMDPTRIQSQIDTPEFDKTAFKADHIAGRWERRFVDTIVEKDTPSARQAANQAFNDVFKAK